MILNTLMRCIFESIQYDEIRPRTEHPIQQRTNSSGELFWSTGDFCGLLATEIGAQRDLMELEWDGNEVYIHHSPNLSELVIYALGIVKGWKAQMEVSYGNIPFDIILSVDYGDKDISPSVTLRFWAVRNQTHYVNPSKAELEKFHQPVLMEQVNYNGLTYC